MNKKHCFCFTGILLGTFLFFTHAVLAKNTPSAVSLDRIVAIVNDEVITESQLNKDIAIFKKQSQHAVPAEKALRHQVLENLVDVELQRQMAKNFNIEVSDERVNSTIHDIAQKHHLTEVQLQEKLRQEGINFNDYRQNLREQLTIHELQRHELGKTITVTDQEVDDLLASMHGQLSAPTAYHVQNILIPLPDEPTSEQVVVAKKLADHVLVKLRRGSDMQQLAIAESTNGMLLQSGDFGWRKLGELPEVFAFYVKTMQAGDVSGPIRAGNGFHVIKLVAIQGGTVRHNTTQTHVRHILIKTNAIVSDAQAKERLLIIKRKIENGAAFEVMAQTNSQDLMSAGKGGDIGWVNPMALDPSFVKAMDQLKPGQMSQPFATQYGWHLIQVLDRKQVDDSKEFRRMQAKEIIYRRKAGEAVQNWLHQLRSQAYIKILL